MQAELTAELGSLNTALALEPVPILEPVPDPIADSIPSDQAATPPLLESLPSPGVAPREVPETIPLDLSAGQVVSFDAKRSRKNKKGRKHAAASSGAPAGAPLDSPTLSRTAAPRVSKEMGIPSGTLVESALSRESSSSRGIPAWAWILVGAIALVAVYFVFWSGTSLIGRTPVESREAPRVAEASPPEPVASPEETVSVASPSPDSHLVLNAVGPQPVRTAPAPVETAPKPSTKPADTIKPPPAGRPSTPQSPSTRQAEPQAPPAALELGPADAGVETIASPVEATAPHATTARGALVDITEVDSPPASLSRKLPAYSMQARQMRLQGTVVLKVLVNEVGAVEQVVVVSGIDGAGLNDATVKAARQWTYRPATKDGVPVKVWTTEQVTFKI
jgi:protein TonB